MDRRFSLDGALTRRRRLGEAFPRVNESPRVDGDALLLLERTNAPLVEEPEEWFRPEDRENQLSSEEVKIAREDALVLAPVYAGLVRLVEYSQRGSIGMTVKFDILGLPSSAPHPFRGIKAGNANGQRVKLMVCTAPDEASDATRPVYQGEAIVSWWTEDTRGVHVSFKLDDGADGYDTHPFRAYPVGDDGQIMTIGTWLLTDDEVIAPAKAKRAFNSMSAVQQSQILCRHDEEFQAFCFSFADSVGVPADPDMPAYKLAAEVVRRYCKIDSRSEFKTNDAAKDAWNGLLAMYRRRSSMARH